ncbi:acidic leucine-rich nuclear phosphoprotein 32-related protein-like isoform X1 [Papaver somniferum]|uniref:acidic leucine-rich nuclear phosphoprotein 32-related protein-like isoform X1 n=1 Tax=Papaver somniferum TaxID=3469 RepID=UPI000E6F9EC6|nr:acidic leucine-rich nuclear phosphoprotein 32-related protein-like isoform X1 [Papaver somniferum]
MIIKNLNHQDNNVEEDGDRVVEMESGAKPDKEYVVEEENDEMLKVKDLFEEEDHTGKSLVDINGFDTVKANAEYPRTETGHTPQDDQKNVRDIVISEERDADTGSVIDSIAVEVREVTANEQDLITETDLIRQDYKVKNMVRDNVLFEGNARVFNANADECIIDRQDDTEELVAEEIENAEMVTDEDLSEEEDHTGESLVDNNGFDPVKDNVEDPRTETAHNPRDDQKNVKDIVLSEERDADAEIRMESSAEPDEDHGEADSLVDDSPVSKDGYIRSGTLPKPKGTGKDAETVYGVVHVKDMTHWVAIRTLLKQQLIVIYDSLRPRGDTERFPEPVRNICTALLARTDRGKWP